MKNWWNYPSRTVKWLLLIVVLVAILFTVLGCQGRATVPRVVESSTIAYEGNEQNAGVLKTWPKKGALLTDRKKAEYDALVERYGAGTVGHPLVPPVVRGRGLTKLRGADEGFPLHEVVWVIDAEHLTYFLLFKQWQRSGRLPL